MLSKVCARTEAVYIIFVSYFIHKHGCVERIQVQTCEGHLQLWFLFATKEAAAAAQHGSFFSQGLVIDKVILLDLVKLLEGL